MLLIIIIYCKALTSVTFTIHRIFYCIACTGLRLAVSVARVTFMKEYASYAMLAPPFMRRTHQKLGDIYVICYPLHHITCYCFC